jgi:hypothetical protein
MSVLQVPLGRRNETANNRKLSRMQQSLTIMATHQRGFASMTGCLRLGITINQQVPVHQRLGGKSSVHDWLGGKASVHDRLGGRVKEEPNNRLEEMADSLVPDEDIVW